MLLPRRTTPRAFSFGPQVLVINSMAPNSVGAVADTAVICQKKKKKINRLLYVAVGGPVGLCLTFHLSSQLLYVFGGTAWAYPTILVWGHFFGSFGGGGGNPRRSEDIEKRKGGGGGEAFTVCSSLTQVRRAF